MLEDLLSQLRQRETEVDDTFTIIFALSWQSLSPEAQTLGCFLSLFGLAPISRTLLDQILAGVENDHLNGDILSKSLNELTRKSLLQVTRPDTYALHDSIRNCFWKMLSELSSADVLKQIYCQGIATIASQMPYDLTLTISQESIPLVPHIIEAATTLKIWLKSEDLTVPYVYLERFYESQGASDLAKLWRERYIDVRDAGQQRLSDKHFSADSNLKSRISLTQLKVLVTISECGSFSDAALTLEMSQSAVSRAIATLESELDVPLLVRGRLGAKLTPVGERVIAHAQQILDLRESIEYEVNLEKALYNSRLRIASFRSAATHLLPPKIAQFQRTYPRVEVSLDEFDPAGVEQALRAGDADLGLLPLPRSKEFTTWEIARDEYVVLLPKRSQATDKPLTWDELSYHSFILLNYAECTTAVQEHWSRWQQPLNVAYNVKEDSTIVSMVAQGLGAAILPRLAAMPIPETVESQPLPVPLERIIGVAILANVPPSPTATRFLDVLTEQSASYSSPRRDA